MRIVLIARRVLYFLGACLIAAGVSTSPSLVSIGVATLAVAAILTQDLRADIRTFWQNKAAVLWVTYYVLTLLSFFYSQSLSSWVDEIRLKLPLLIIPYCVSVLLPLSTLRWLTVKLIFFAVVTLVMVATVINYLAHYAFYTEAILHSTSIPVITLSKSLSHIYYGIMAAFAVFLGFELASYLTKTLRYSIYVCCAFLVIALHLLTYRTGVLALYSGAFCMIIYWGIKNKKYLLGLVFVGVISLLPIISYYSMEGVRNRVENTTQDLKMYNSGADISNWSVARRLAVWQTAWHVYLTSPIVGVSPADTKNDILAQYNHEPFKINLSARVADPHNQYIEALTGLGIIGLLVLMAALCYPFFTATFVPAYIFIAFVGVITSSMLVECTLERQLGVTFIIFFFMTLVIKRDTTK